MSQRQSESASEIVEKYRKKYCQTERQALKKVILKNHPQLNMRTLDRHLKKAFESNVSHPETVEKRATREITETRLPEESELDARFIAAVERLRSILFRFPTVDEIAVETCITPEGAEKLAYKLAAKTNWFNPKPDLIRYATEKLGEVLVCAERMKIGKANEDGKSEEFDYQRYDDDGVIVEEAKRFLKIHPNLLPKLTDEGVNVVSWPFEALKFLGENYKPREREWPFLAVVPR